MPLTSRSNSKLISTLLLFEQFGLGYPDNQKYLAQPGDYLTVTEFLNLADTLFNRLPDKVSRFDIDILRGCLGARLQAEMGRQEIRLILPFTVLGWSGMRMYISKNELNILAPMITASIAIPERFTEDEKNTLAEVLSKAEAVWCLNSGDSFASEIAALAHEQAWELALTRKQQIQAWWADLKNQDKEEVLKFIQTLWKSAPINEEIALNEFYAVAVVRNSRWFKTGLLNIDFPSSVEKLVDNEIFYVAGLTRPIFGEIEPLLIAESFGEKNNSNFVNIIKDSLFWLGHLPTSPKNLIFFGNRAEQLSTVLQGVFSGTTGQSLQEFKQRLISSYQFVKENKIKLDELIANIDIRTNAAKMLNRELPPLLVMNLEQPILPPDYLSRVRNLLPYLPVEFDDKVLNLVNELIVSLKQLWYVWYILLEKIRSFLKDFYWLNDLAKDNPLWDLRSEKVLEFVTKNIDWLIEHDIDLIKELEVIIHSVSWFKLHDGEVPTYSRYPDNLFAVCAIALEKSEVILKDTQITVGKLIFNYRTSSTKSERAGFERLQFVNELKLAEPAKAKYLKILGWYDGLLRSQTEYNEFQNFWQNIEEYLEEYSPENFDKATIVENELTIDQDQESNITKPEKIEQLALETINETRETNSSIKSDDKKYTLIKKVDTSSIKEALPVNELSIIHSTPQAIKSDKPALVFNLEDEKEVDKHRGKIKNVEEKIILEKQIRAFIDEVIEKKNLIFRDDVNKRRFIQLMVSRLKDVRGSLEVAEVLSRAIEDGGLGMNEEKTEQVQEIIEAAKREFEEKRKNQQLPIPEPQTENLPRPEAVKVIPPRPITNTENTRQQWREQILKEIENQSSETITADRPVLSPKPQLVDVKAPPKVVGPLEELRTLSLVDFRRLGSTPQEALSKIKGKIDLLGENSITRRVEAVRAWKSSVVYQQYLRLGRESIEQGKTIGVIVGAHQAQGDSVLTEEEFNAIADFNAKLRF